MRMRRSDAVSVLPFSVLSQRSRFSSSCNHKTTHLSICCLIERAGMGGRERGRGRGRREAEEETGVAP